MVRRWRDAVERAVPPGLWCHGHRLGVWLMTIKIPALARHLPVRLGHQVLE